MKVLPVNVPACTGGDVYGRGGAAGAGSGAVLTFDARRDCASAGDDERAIIKVSKIRCREDIVYVCRRISEWSKEAGDADKLSSLSEASSVI